MSFVRGVCKFGRNIQRYNGVGSLSRNNGQIVGCNMINNSNNNNSNNSNNIYMKRDYTTTATANNTANTEITNNDTTNESVSTEVPYQFLSLTNEQWELALGKEVSKSSKDFFEMVKKGRTTLLRKPAFEAIQWLSRMKEQQFLKESPQDYCLVLDGIGGSGKSITLSQVTFWAQQQNWLVVYIPNSATFINQGALSHFDLNPLLFAQNELAFNFIKQFVEINHAKLKEISLKTKFKISHNNWESSTDKTLYDLLSSTKFDGASEILYHFKRELNAVHEFPVLIAIDGYNHFHRTSEYGDMYDSSSTLRSLPTDRLLAASLFKDITSHQISNGVVIASTTDVIPKREMFKVIPSENILEVSTYSLYELKLYINFLVESGYIEKTPNKESIEYLWQLSSGNPRELWKLLRILH